MFGFLKNTLKSTIGLFKKKAEEELEIQEEVPSEKSVVDSSKKEEKKPIEAKKEAKEGPKKEEKKPEDKKKEERIAKPVVKEPATERLAEKPKPVVEAPKKQETPPPEEKKGFFSKISDIFKKKHEEEPQTPKVEEKAKPEGEDVGSKKYEVRDEKPEIKKEEPIEKEHLKEKPAVKKPEIKEKPKTFEKPKPVIEETKEEVIKRKIEEVIEPAEKKEEEIKPVIEELEEQEEEKKEGFFQKITGVVTKKTISEGRFEDMFTDFELALLENNVALEVIDKIKKDLHDQLVNQKVFRKDIGHIIIDTLKDSITEVLSAEQINIFERIKAKEQKPYVIAFFGVNGSGKTTNIAKLAHYLDQNKVSSVIAACDTFRAAAIQQLEEHANNVGIKVIKHDYGADPAAVAFDAIKHAEAKGKDVVLIDTAGRLHSNTNLMDELKKIVKVAKPDLKIFIGESITGNDCVEQAKKYNEEIGIDGIILTKADVDEKGGAALSVSYITGKPIMFMGTGQGYDDLQVFDKKAIVENLGL